MKSKGSIRHAPHWVVVIAVFAAQWAIAGEPAATPNAPSKTTCANGNRDCAPAEMDARIKEAARQAREAVCGRNTQDCDARGKARRRDSDAESRDRHACRER